MTAKTVQAPSWFEDAIGADMSWLLAGHTIEFAFVVMVLTTVCLMAFGVVRR